MIILKRGRFRTRVLTILQLTRRGRLTRGHGDEFAGSVQGDDLARLKPAVVIVMKETSELEREGLGRHVEQQLRQRHGEYPVAQFLPDEKSEDLEGGFEPERRGHDEDLFQPRRVAALQQGQHLLAQVVVKVGVLGT